MGAFGGIISAITGGGGGIKDLVLGILDRIKVSPTEKAKIQEALDQNAFELQKMQLEMEQHLADLQAKETEAASANIQAEAKSGDKFVSRSRPTFLYIMYAVITFNFIILPVIEMIRGATTLVPLNIPSEAYWLFGSGYLGYAGFRSLDKSGFQWNKK
jgi:hypothetical protein